MKGVFSNQLETTENRVLDMKVLDMEVLKMSLQEKEHY